MLISLLQQNFQIKKCSRVANSASKLTRDSRFCHLPFRAKFLSRPILFESGGNWNLKFGFLRQYVQKTIFQIKWTKNTDELKKLSCLI